MSDDLEYHQQLVGRVAAYLAGRGLSRVDLEPSDAFPIMVETRGDEEEALATFFDILHWMRDEGFIRVRTVQPVQFGECWNGVQVTAKAIGFFKEPQAALDNATVQKAVADNPGGLPSDTYSKIADALGSFLGGVGKSLASG